jgi:hypothetical protein
MTCLCYYKTLTGLDHLQLGYLAVAREANYLLTLSS